MGYLVRKLVTSRKLVIERLHLYFEVDSSNSFSSHVCCVEQKTGINVCFENLSRDTTWVCITTE